MCIVLDAIDISSNTTGQINISVMAAANDVSNAYDSTDGDGIFVTYSVDGGGSLAAHSWMYYSPNGGTNEYLAHDENNNGTIDLSETDILTKNFETKNRDLSITGNSLVITICAHSNSSSEEWALDNIVVTSATVLPVELTSFEVVNRDENMILSWSTASELNNQGFELQRSGDGRKWKKLGFINAKNNSGTASTYSFSDLQPLRGINYYRLKQIDYNGTFKFSKVVSATTKGISKIRIHPNPTNDLLFIDNIDTLHFDLIELYNYLGKQITIKKTPDNNQRKLTCTGYVVLGINN